MTRSRAVAAVAIALSALLGATGCTSSGDTEESETGSITVWIPEDVPERVSAMEAIFADFTESSGTEVELVAVAEDQLVQLLTASAAAGDLPDVLGGLALPVVRTLSTNELIDTEAVGAVLSGLGEDTFSSQAIALTKDGSTQLAVPSESWAQLLYYRKDLFDKAGLAAPTSYANILAAAEALDSSDVAGFAGANASGDAFTEQTFEHIALGNDCQMVDDAGTVLFDSPQCVESLKFYGDLIGQYSLPGIQDVDTTRAAYFAGQAAMTIWSTFLLDELAGLREDAKPTCDECVDDPTFLSSNTGVVTAIEGSSGTQSALFGEITSWTITTEAATEASKEFVDYMMTDGYVPYLAIAPEGKVPVRPGTAENPTQYADAWAELEVGVDSKAPLSDFYPPEVLEALTSASDEMSRWAIPQGQGELLGATQGEQPVATAVNEVTTGTDASTAATELADSVREIQESIK
jgi:multiple sugar transport system substrate-binding protein